MNRKNALTLSGMLLMIAAVAALVVACAGPAVAVNPAAAETKNAPQTSAQTGTQANAAQPASPANKPAAGVVASLSDAPMNRSKFPNGALKIADSVSFVGRTVKVEGTGYTAGSKLDLVYGTFDGSFKLGDQLEFYNFQFTEKNVPIATVSADAAGKFTQEFTVPEDYGGVHNIYALSEGEKVMQAGLTVRTEYFISPLSGPVGTPIQIKITGIGYAKWEESRTIAYDNQFTGLINGILTKGTAVATIRASGAPGKHNVRVSSGAQMPYMNVQQSPNYFPGRVQDFTFTITAGDPATQSTQLSAEWPDRGNRETVVKADLVGPKGELLTVTPNVATVGTPLKLSASGFAPNTTIDLQWEAMRGNRNSGWSAQPFPLDKITTDAQGRFARDLSMPDDLGGEHALVAMLGNVRVADTHLVIQPSILDMTPRSGPAGTDIKIVLKGVGWTEVDNVYVMTYDNAITGYACGFNSNGDVTIMLKATGAPGWHFVDMWPSVYVGHLEQPWVPDIPWLSFASHPGLPKPALHMAFKVAE